MQQSLTSPPKVNTLHLPPQLTPFIGRTREMTEIINRLTASACRLLTLIGPGGIGKTRLAIQVAIQVAGHFAQGVYFVPLQAVQSANFLITTIADALKVPLSGSEEPIVQLFHFLRDKQVLLVLDHFEQLLGEDGATLAAQILASTPGVKLLVTSREILSLQEEWLYPVQGLPYPTSPQAPLLGGEGFGVRYAAIQLFNERARQVRPDFSLAMEQDEVIRICRLVEGMPLALELAASWTKTLSCAVIVAEIQRNLDFLSTNLRNVPDRQRSMRAVFDHSWQLLSEEERSAFKRLAIFRGGFQREAAQRVTGASLATLSALVDKSLLRAEVDGRYQMHELLRQYAAERLAQSPEDVGRMYDRHCAYYVDFLQERANEVIGVQQRQVIRELTAELENIRAAWQWAVVQQRITDLQKAVYPYSQICDFQSRYQEAADAFEQAIHSLESAAPSPQKELTLAILLTFLGWDYVRLGRLEDAQTMFERGRAIFSNLATPPPEGFATDPLNGLALVAHILGNYAEATRLGEEALHLNQARGDKLNIQLTLYVLANIAFAQGRFEVAQNYSQQGYALAQATDNRWFMAYLLIEMGNIARALGDYVQARQHYQASYTIREEFDDPEGMAVALNHMGKMATLQENYGDAEQLYRRSLAIYQEIYDQGGLATSLAGLGRVYSALGQIQSACQHFQRALQITAEMQFVPLTLSILSGIGELLLQTGRPERGLELLALALHHPAGDHETKARTQQHLTHHQSILPPAIFTAAAQRGAASDLEAVIATVQAELASLFQAQEQAIQETAPKNLEAGEKVISPTFHPSNLPILVDPLTPRELEVLQLIAEGLTNQQIAENLIISVGTAKFYTSQIYSKLNVSSRTQAVAKARELGLLS